MSPNATEFIQVINQTKPQKITIYENTSFLALKLEKIHKNKLNRQKRTTFAQNFKLIDKITTQIQQ